MHARTLRYHANVSRQFPDSSRRFGESIRKPIANSLHPSEIGALDKISDKLYQISYIFIRYLAFY